MKGIVLAGGSGTRLHPITLAVSKQLIPVYDKPMIYYPISTLIYAGIRDILIISTPKDTPIFERLLGDGSKFGCNFSYKIQNNPNGLAQAFVLGEDFIGNDKVCLILGDNIFQMKIKPLETCLDVNGGIIFGYHVNDPKRYGVVEFDSDFKAISIEEKPENPRSNYAVPGLYFYDNSVINVAKSLKPSDRGEFEITDVNKFYLENNNLEVRVMGKGSVWLDTGTIESLMKANMYIQVIEERQGRKIGCIEEAAFQKGFISEEELIKIAKPLKKSGYGNYLESLI
ncbi:MAG: glucose-1-phosphate thymidylyltransferase RfbA [Flavobacteriaceae bacterium]|nr:glucose-1-phosphate thymidylyltransferase RfbA [Flavobacteriaceae bacterium]|tara:strand:- start:435 stop:1286 length:852 start_codon:yes stop_codon:yes gene_type:complete